MYNIFDKLREKFSNEQISYLRQIVEKNIKNELNISEFMGRTYSNRETFTVTLLPIYENNKDTTLKIRSFKQYAITSESKEISLSNIVRTTGTNLTEENKIVLLTIKRGNTFINEYFKDTGFKYLDRISLYLQLNPHHKVKAFKKDNTIVICSNVEGTEYLRRITSALPILLNENFKFTENTIELYRSLAVSDDGSEFVEKLTKYIQASKILEEQKIKEFSEKLKLITENEYNQKISQIHAIEKDIDYYEKKLYVNYNQLRKAQAEATFYKPTLDIIELTKYIMSNPNIADFAIGGNALILAIEAPLEYIEIPAFKRLIQNAGSFIWPKWNKVPEQIARHKEEFIQLLSDLFLGTRYTLYTRSEIIIDFTAKEAYPFTKLGNHSNNELRPSIQKAYPESWKINNRLKENKTITPHMHIEFYDCWSGNKANITKCLTNNDIIGAIDIAVNTTKDINVTDSTVFSCFLREGLWAPQANHHYAYNYSTRPDLQFKTIYDSEQKCFRTFGDIFYNDYVKENITQFDINEDFSDIL